jgi:sugar phosphate isomerase/epimerase
VKIGIQTARLPGETLQEQFEAAKLCGFDAVEINIGPAFDLGKRLDEIKRAVNATGVPVCAICTHSMHDPLQPEAGERERRFVALTGLLALGEELGAAGVVSVPVRRPVTDQELGDSGGRLFAHAVEQFRAWASGLPAGRCALFLEPLNRYEATFLRRVEQAVELAAAVDHPRVQALADLFHMNIEEADQARPIVAAGSRLGHIHVADNNRLQPGRGCLDFATPFAALKKIGYGGYISIECTAPSGGWADASAEPDLQATQAFLRREWDNA